MRQLFLIFAVSTGLLHFNNAIAQTGIDASRLSSILQFVGGATNANSVLGPLDMTHPALGTDVQSGDNLYDVKSGILAEHENLIEKKAGSGNFFIMLC